MKNQNQVLEYILDRLDDPSDGAFAESLNTALSDLVSDIESQRAIVETVVIPTSEDMSVIESAVKRKYPVVSEIKYELNREILGGVKIRVADQLLDFSLATQLITLQKSFL